MDKNVTYYYYRSEKYSVYHNGYCTCFQTSGVNGPTAVRAVVAAPDNDPLSPAPWKLSLATPSRVRPVSGRRNSGWNEDKTKQYAIHISNACTYDGSMIVLIN